MIPQLKYTDEGVIAPTIQELQDGLWRVMEKAFGSNLNRQYSTPQGQMVTSLAAEFSDMNNNLINLMNLVDPRFSYGVMQDAVGEIYFLQRKQATRSLVQLRFTGLNGVVIPKGFLVSDIDGKQWRTTESRLISNGFTLVNAECTEFGSIPAEIGAITAIITNINGVDAVINNTPAIIGRDTESREDFECRRAESVGKNAKNTNASVLGEVLNLKGVIDCHVVDNPTDQTVEVGATNYPLIRNSLAVSVVGGNDQDIAKAILTKGGSACSFVGNTDVLYEDYETYTDFPPKYDVKFIRPTHTPVYFTVEVEDMASVGHEQERYVKDNILRLFNSGRLKGRIGQRLVANRYICGISNIENNVIIGIFIGLTPDERMNILDFGIDQYPILSELNIKIVGA